MLNYIKYSFNNVFDTDNCKAILYASRKSIPIQGFIITIFLYKSRLAIIALFVLAA